MRWLEAKNIYFYVPELNSFFFMTPDHILKDLEYRFPRETVNDNLMNYSINNIYSIDDIADCRHHYYESFENKSIVFPEVLELFRENKLMNRFSINTSWDYVYRFNEINKILEYTFYI